MEKKILVAVDDSIRSTHAIQHAVKMSSLVRDLTYTLFHVHPAIPPSLSAGAGTDSKAQLKWLKRKNAELAWGMLEKYKAEMVRMGIADNRIDAFTHPKVRGLPGDILARAEERLYDAIVVGRGGLPRVQKTFMRSVTVSLVEDSNIVPVWVINGNVASMKIMLAVDGSESSLRAVDHLGLMVGGNAKIKVMLFHVTPKFGDYSAIRFDEKQTGIEEVITRGARRCVEHFYGHAQRKLKQAGIRENQIEIRVSDSTVMNVGKAIVDEAKKGNYGTVVIGRQGVSKAFLMGSVSRYLLDRISNLALWLVS